jgi:hypothetical protein
LDYIAHRPPRNRTRSGFTVVDGAEPQKSSPKPLFIRHAGQTRPKIVRYFQNRSPQQWWAMQYIMHAFNLLLVWVEHFSPKHWLLALLLVVLFGYFCMTGLGRART